MASKMKVSAQVFAAKQQKAEVQSIKQMFSLDAPAKKAAQQLMPNYQARDLGEEFASRKKAAPRKKVVKKVVDF